MDTNQDYKLLIMGPTGPALWTLAELFAKAPAGGIVAVDPPATPAGPTTPIEPTLPTVPVSPLPTLAGVPRVPVGHKNGNPICECTINGVTGLIQIVGENPDAFLSRGYNLDYEPIGGKPTGPSSGNYGNDPLFDTRPEGYRKRYFSDKRLFWEQSSDADEPEPVSITITPSEPVQIVIDQFPDLHLTDDQMVVWNPEVFSPLVQWKNGLARIQNAVALTPGPGENYFVSIGGQPPTIGFPQEYTLQPGDQVAILVYLSPQPDRVLLDGNKKGYAKLRLGNSPQTA